MKCWFIKIFMGMALAFLFPVGSYADVIFRENKELKISVITLEQPVVHTALEMFSKDYQKVFSGRIAIIENAQLYIGTLGMGSVAEKECAKKWLATLQQHAEGFVIYVKNDKLYVVGSDKRGTAYGILELSRMIGVSPWEWWADAQIEKKQKFLLKNGFLRIEHPSVKHRGIFINDEDWGLMPWSSKTFEPGLPTLGKTKGTIGPKTYSKIFELLLRLRANTIWPAMHEVTVPFYFTKGNKEAADKYGIIVSTSHCEPLMRNSATEWDIAGKGAYNYVTNREAILNYWTDRLKELKGSDNIYTIGLRGKHDGMMEGVKTQKEHKQVLTQVIKDERSLLSENINPDVRKVPQAFIPYKEVLDVYNDGLEVPEDVTLVWCDDNYGYIKHFPNEKERARKGGNGVYYHVSYWGRPHDYLWLATNHPAQLFTQMKRAYDNGAKDFWILNVGDIKPAEYLTELFLDMAWNINAIENNEQGLNKHLQTWLSREFGESNAASLLDIMNEYYRLAYIHKPEFMGATRTEEKDPKYKIVTDLPWSESQINKRMKAYKSIADKVTALSAKIPTDKQDAWFQLIAYPVLAAASMNDKCLFGQLARHGKADWKQSDEAYEKIGDLTQKYNSLNNGKWKGIMDFQPRKLSVFDKLTHEKADEAVVNNAAEYIKNQAPDLSWVYLEYTDDMGHMYGDSPEYFKAVEMMDNQMGRLWKSIQYREQNFKEDWVIYITTDHGRTANNGKGHGGQTDRERATWIVTNAKGLNNYFKTGNPGVVDIMPSMAKFLDIKIPRDHWMEVDGIPLTGNISATAPNAVLQDGKIKVTWTAISKKGKAKIWLSTTNYFKEGKKDAYSLIAKVPVNKQEAFIDVSKIPSDYYKIAIETPNNIVNRWVKK